MSALNSQFICRTFDANGASNNAVSLTGENNLRKARQMAALFAADCFTSPEMETEMLPQSEVAG